MWENNFFLTFLLNFLLNIILIYYVLNFNLILMINIDFLPFDFNKLLIRKQNCLYRS